MQIHVGGGGNSFIGKSDSFAVTGLLSLLVIFIILVALLFLLSKRKK